eukprot:1950158-Rhodomonas_salina.1
MKEKIAGVADPEFCTKVWQAIYNAYRPKTTGMALDLNAKLGRVCKYDGTKELPQLIAEARVLINRLTTLGFPPSTLTTVSQIEESIIEYAMGFPEGAVEKT